MATYSNYALRVPASLMEDLRSAAERDGVSMNGFIVQAVARRSRRCGHAGCCGRWASRAVRVSGGPGRRHASRPDGGAAGQGRDNHRGRPRGMRCRRIGSSRAPDRDNLPGRAASLPRLPAPSDRPAGVSKRRIS